MKTTILKILFIAILMMGCLRAMAGEVTITGQCPGFKTGDLAIAANQWYDLQIENDQFELTIPLIESPQVMALHAQKKKKFLVHSKNKWIV